MRRHLYRSRPRPTRRRAGAQLILLLGTPGTGKRTLGSYLAETAGFTYLDFGDAGTRRRYLEGDLAALREAVDAAREEGRGLAISWEAGAGDQLDEVARLRAVGFEPFWLDGDRGAACAAHFTGAPRRARRFRFVDAFDPDGRFRPLEALAREIVAEPAAARLAAARMRPARPRRTARLRGARAGIAAGLAAWALAAAAALAALVVLPGTGRAPAGARAPARPALAASAASPGALPRHGILVSGRSLAGIALGDTMAAVRSLWGGHYTRCGSCSPTEWLYFFPGGDPAGAGVEFDHGRVVAVFTLGSPSGWRTDTGIEVGDILGNPRVDSNPRVRWELCSGYGAQSSPPAHGAVTSILTQGAAVYGFALTRPSVSPCA